MICISTRGAAPPIDFVDAVVGGVARDGGLYVPQRWPRFPREAVAGFAGRPYAEVAAAVLTPFASPRIDPQAIARLCQDAYAAFDHPAVTPLVQIAPGRFILELFHGPSLAFKDIALQLMARLYDQLLAESERRATIVCATSGDTGGAAVEAFAGARAIRLVALYPEGRISEVQRRFMTTAGEANVRAVALDADFDACQAILKALFSDAEFARDVDLAAVNSINLARIVAQSTYYFVAAAALGGPDRPVSFAIPTGNFGDAYAGHAAARMGLPIEKLVVATNSNDIVARAFRSGRYARGATLATISPAMDIQVASNFERLWFDSLGGDAAATAKSFDGFARSGAVDIPPAAHASMRSAFDSAVVGEERTREVMRRTFEETGLFIDPHTAVALAGALATDDGSAAPTVVLSTAHPAKFAEAVEAATGSPPPTPARVREIEKRPERLERLPADVETVKAYVRSFAA